MDLDFLCIGVQKAGTSWLDQMLRSHPRVWIPYVKELHYYDEQFVDFVRSWAGEHRLRGAAEALGWQHGAQRPDPALIREAAFIGRRTVDAAWYRDLFAMCPPGRLKGEVTPEYCLVPDEGIQQIRRDNPRAHFFLLLREPVSRDLSHIRMMLANEGHDPAQGLATYEHRFPEYLEWLAYERRGDYLPILERWHRSTEPGRLHVLFFERIARDPWGVLRQVCGPLGIDPRGVRENVKTVVHQGREFVIPDRVVAALRAHHEPARREILARYGPIPGW